MNDQQLFKTFGQQAILFRQKCIGLLPEIYEKQIHRKNGYDSIFEFAAKLAGISQEQVKRALSLNQKFQDKPALRAALTSGEVSINKLARIASIATPENQEILATQAKLLSKSALETLVKDERQVISKKSETAQLSLPEAKISASLAFVPGHRVLDMPLSIGVATKLELSEEVTSKLADLQSKGLDINALILEMLEKRNQEIAEEKQQIAASIKPTKSRYIAVKIRQLLQKEHGKKCSMPNCTKQAATLHHTQRFALSHSHDPRFIAPLCHNHHKIAHSIDLKTHQLAKTLSPVIPSHLISKPT